MSHLKHQRRKHPDTFPFQNRDAPHPKKRSRTTDMTLHPPPNTKPTAGLTPAASCKVPGAMAEAAYLGEGLGSPSSAGNHRGLMGLEHLTLWVWKGDPVVGHPQVTQRMCLGSKDPSIPWECLPFASGQSTSRTGSEPPRPISALRPRQTAPCAAPCAAPREV